MQPLEILIPADKYDLLLDLQGSKGAFSCNGMGEVWPTERWGLHDEEIREHLEGLEEYLDQIVDVILVRDSRGRRFRVIEDSIVLADPYESDRVIAHLVVMDVAGR